MNRRLALFITASVAMLCACRDQPLLHQLTEQQANEVVAVLQSHNVSASKEDQGKTGYAINVAATDFPAAVDLLHKYNLPPKPRLEIGQLFPSDALVASPQAERARLLSGIEQRIEQTLATLDNVVTARVQVSYPLGASVDNRFDFPMHAAVLITYRNDVNADLLVSEVKRFVKNSFTNVDYDDISVILHPARDVYRGPTTEVKIDDRVDWRYWLLPPLGTLGLATVGWFAYVRMRHRLWPHKDQGRGGGNAATETNTIANTAVGSPGQSPSSALQAPPSSSMIGTEGDPT
jgi:type III secretion protein J